MKQLSLKASRRRLANFECIEVMPEDTTFDPDQHLTLIMFHGYGADAHDLASLAFETPTKKPVHWLFVQGPLAVPIGPGHEGRAWWPIDISRLQRAASQVEDYNLSEVEPPALTPLRPKIFELIKQLRKPWSQIALGGFSQGAMLATDIYLHAPENPAGLTILSGTMICQKKWTELVAQRAKHKFFQSHGHSDQVLAYKYAQKLETFLTQNGLKGHLDSFQGGHEIPAQVIQKLGSYLSDL
ncbi:MAG: alpha/beta hydrolase [Pseudobdellovibrionaceae bacterium]